VSRIECYSSCNVLKVEKLDAIECGVVGVFIAPTTKNGRWKTAVACPPDSLVRHRTLSGALAMSASRWGSTVGALTCGASGLSGAPTAHALTLARTVAHLMRLQSTVAREVAVAPLAHRTLSGASPDSPVNYSGAPTDFFEGSEFSVECPSAPDTVRWCTGHCPVAHQTVRCARPGCLWIVFCSLCLNPFLVFLLAYCELGTCKN
jgi:hypothetical protein